jgi:hypothetical protein
MADTERTRAALKAFFESLDTPTESEYSDLIQSFVTRLDDYKDKAGVPVVGDDDTQGYKIFDFIRDTTNGDFYMCFDNSTGAAVWKNISSASSSSFKIQIPAGGWDRPKTNYAEFQDDYLINGEETSVEWFDSATEEFLREQFILPDTLPASVPFELWGVQKVYSASKNVKFKIYTSIAGDDGSINASFTAVDSGDLAITSTGQDKITKLTFSKTPAELGLTGGEGKHCVIKLSRVTASIDNHPGDFGILNFEEDLS